MRVMYMNSNLNGLVYGVQLLFRQYFSHIVAVGFIDGENHRPIASH